MDIEIGVEVERAPVWACLECHGPAVGADGTVRCIDPECRVVRILPSLPERLPWEPEQ